MFVCANTSWNLSIALYITSLWNAGEVTEFNALLIIAVVAAAAGVPVIKADDGKDDDGSEIDNEDEGDGTEAVIGSSAATGTDSYNDDSETDDSFVDFD